jgi:hypothetical protein
MFNKHFTFASVIMQNVRLSQVHGMTLIIGLRNLFNLFMHILKF